MKKQMILLGMLMAFCMAEAKVTAHPINLGD